MANKERCLSAGMSYSNWKLIRFMIEHDDERLTDRLRSRWLERAGFRASVHWTDKVLKSSKRD